MIRLACWWRGHEWYSEHYADGRLYAPPCGRCGALNPDLRRLVVKGGLLTLPSGTTSEQRERVAQRLEPPTVYIVESGDFDEHNIDGYFLDRDLAQRWADTLRASKPRRAHTVEEIAVTVTEPPP